MNAMEPGTLKIRDIRDYLWIFAIEAVGTTIMLFGIMMSPDSVGNLVCAIFAAGVFFCKYSGAHYNGGLSIAIYIVVGRWKEHLYLVFVYWLAELLGAYLGISIAYSIAGYKNMSFLGPGEASYSGFYIAYVEIVGTFIMITMILYTKFQYIGPGTDRILNNLAVVITIYCCINMCKPYSGAAFNPTNAIA